MRVLVIEDEKRIANFIERGLKEEAYVVDVASNGVDGLFQATNVTYDLIVLDLMLPDLNGIDICREVRRAKVNTPILILTARDSVQDKVRGLDSGADDYLTKPFSFDEFLARVRALLRKNRAVKTTTLRIGDIELDQLTRKVKRGDTEIHLANKEYALLEYLMLHANQVVTRTMISEHVWHEDFDSLTNIFDVYIHRLRKKLNEGFDDQLIQSVRGVGYVLQG
ncbi:MAG: response regulator transcription factor [Candidatus Omnitrophica bacterium]|nr:response regulator transcription factor [Candidatus Omnitrophota bacterium]